MVCKFNDLNRIGCNELVLQLRKSKASTMVQAPLFFGRRSLLRWACLRRCSAVDGDGELRRLLQLDKMLGRFGFSPGCFQGDRRGESRTEATLTSPIPAVCCKRERRKSADWGRISPILLARMHHASRRSSGSTRRCFGWSPSTARKHDRS
jgi:hypothetical protein